MNIDYSCLPEHMQGAAQRYIENGIAPGSFLTAVICNENGIAPGSFLTAVICNDLMNAFGRADETNRDAMQDWVRFFYNDAPSTCWGSPAKVEAWIARGGMNAEATT